MRLILVAPGLLAQRSESLASMPELTMLASLARPPVTEESGIDAALLGAVLLPRDTPFAPLSALGAGVETGDAAWLQADPVHLEAGRDDVVLAQRIDDLSPEESASLLEALNRHFADDGLRFVAPRPDAWFANLAQAPAITTTPLAAVRHRSLYAQLPRGPQGGIWKRWHNEIEMLFHEHPVNTAREAAGRASANALWFSGNGRLADVSQPRCLAVHAAPGRAGDLARGIAHRAGIVAAGLPLASGGAAIVAANATLPPRSDAGDPTVIAALPAVADASALERFAGEWLRPALEGLARGRLGSLLMIADGNDTATVWTLGRPTWRDRIALRMRRRPFVVPPAPDA